MDRKYAILGDIHANLEALTAVVGDAREKGVTDFVCVGDVVGYNASPSECIRMIRELGCVTVRGNHDHYCSYDESLDDFQPLAASVIAWTRRQLSEEDGKWLRDLPYQKACGGFTLVHSTLDMPERWGYVFDTLAAEANFSYQMTALCFHGHTHVPMIYEKQREVMRVEPCKVKLAFGQKFFVNVGSVGQPRDADPRSAYVLYCAKTKEFEFVRVPYDIEAAMEKNLKAGLPERLALRLAQGR
ncbi:MAG: metallophosphoesterase family protein [Kiritimatiellia bacterium]|jgi:diadenosine tetraphosphatase ApaH/serine/threonine PP2A family protein phosphatase|nr:metallophosphoesterase family protein [Kiritimatiellia bacterium]